MVIKIGKQGSKGLIGMLKGPEGVYIAHYTGVYNDVYTV